MAWTQIAKAQVQSPVHWSYGIKKGLNGIVEIHLLAKIDTGWHIYAQKQSADAIATPTQIRFEKQSGLTLIGIPAEIGKKERYEVKEAGIVNQEYKDKVDFVQRIKPIGDIKTIKVSVTWQSCTHKMCLPEETLEFNIPLKK